MRCTSCLWNGVCVALAAPSSIVGRGRGETNKQVLATSEALREFIVLDAECDEGGGAAAGRGGGGLGSAHATAPSSSSSIPAWWAAGTVELARASELGASDDAALLPAQPSHLAPRLVAGDSVLGFDLAARLDGGGGDDPLLAGQ